VFENRETLPCRGWTTPGYGAGRRAVRWR
jgi:hypothetical protein